jgi:predicted RNA-binding protein (virulence factor B family)
VNKNIKIGVINLLKIDRQSDHGLHLIAEDKESVLLPKAYVKEDMNFGDEIEVFVYTDSEDRPIATTLKPKAKLGEFASFEIVDIASFGAFASWDLAKDLFIPLSEQKGRYKIGGKYILRVCLDEETNRLYGTQKIGKYLSKDTRELQKNQPVELFILAQTPLGYKVIVDQKHEGMLFKNEIFEDIQIGEQKKGFVKQIREDGKLDLSLQPIGEASKDDAKEKILQVLKNSNSPLKINSKSDPEEIKKIFSLSKKAFKKALNSLLDEQLILLDEKEIKLKN